VNTVQFRPDLYERTAPFYESFRPVYPAAVLLDLAKRTGSLQRPADRLVDLGCGTGQITFGLSGLFDSVIAVDQEPDMVEFGITKSDLLDITNIRWLATPAQELDMEDGSVDLVTIGNAFHRLPRELIADHAKRWIRPGGHIALLWSYIPWHGPAEWQIVARSVIEDWKERFGTADRVPANLASTISEKPHQEVLDSAGFDVVGKFEYPTLLSWTPGTLAGFAFSMSVMARPALDERVGDFEEDLRLRLLEVEPSGLFRQRNDFAIDLARQPE